MAGTTVVVDGGQLCVALRGITDEAMDFTLSPEIEDIRVRTRAFVEEHVLPLEADPANFAEHENIPLDRLAPVQAKAKQAGPVGAAVAEGIRRHAACRSWPGR